MNQTSTRNVGVDVIIVQDCSFEGMKSLRNNPFISIAGLLTEINNVKNLI
ncbi:MAG: hypothetical protein ACP5OH_02315 [Nitrososphaerota archaeon]